MRSNSNARNVNPSQSFSFKRKCLITYDQCKWKVSERLWEALRGFTLHSCALSKASVKALLWPLRDCSRCHPGCSEGGMMRLDTLIELEFLNSSSSSSSSFRNSTNSSLSSNSRQQYLRQWYLPPPLRCVFLPPGMRPVPRTKNLDLRGLDPGRFSMSRGGIPRCIGNLPEIWSRRESPRDSEKGWNSQRF